MSGLIAYYDRFHHHYLRVTATGPGRINVAVVSWENHESSRIEAVELSLNAGQDLRLAVEMDHTDLRFFWATGNDAWETADRVLEATMLGDWVSPLSNFTGTFWGLCCQDLFNRSAWADFDYFAYQPDPSS